MPKNNQPVNDPHFILKGKMGVVSHTLKSSEMVLATARFGDPADDCFNDQRQQFFHVPSGTFVMVVSDPVHWAESPKNVQYYKVIWEELVCWVKKEHVINPYFVQTLSSHE